MCVWGGGVDVELSAVYRPILLSDQKVRCMLLVPEQEIDGGNALNSTPMTPEGQVTPSVDACG